MVEIVEKNEFIEIEYSGRIKDGEIFDSTILEEAKKLNPDVKEVKPYILCIGQNMVLPAIDDFLTGKEVGKPYLLELPAEKAFGKRDKNLVKTVPISVFRQQDISPQQGMVFSFDNMLGRISAVSGGRIIVDFNNPLAGKDVIYDIKIKRKITDINEKIKTLMQAFYRAEFDFSVENKKLIIKTEKGIEKFIMLFAEKFKEILGLDLEVKEKPAEEPNQPSQKG